MNAINAYKKMQDVKVEYMNNNELVLECFNKVIADITLYKVNNDKELLKNAISIIEILFSSLNFDNKNNIAAGLKEIYINSILNLNNILMKKNGDLEIILNNFKMIKESWGKILEKQNV